MYAIRSYYGSVTNASCFGVPDGSISASPDGGTGDYNYLWSNAQPDYVISNLAPGNYSLTVKDGNNCIANTSVVVNQPPEIVINLTHTDAVCGETRITSYNVCYTKLLRLFH